MKTLYLHGFQSSAKSAKAAALARWIPLTVPELSPYPQQAYAQAQAFARNADLIIGSSLGGYYATSLSQTLGKRAVVINPSVRPFKLLADYLGENTNPYTHSRYTLTQSHLDYLESLYQPLHTPELILLLQQKGDEVLDWTQAADFYKDSRSIIEPGGSHAFENLDKHYTTILEFAQL